MKGRHACRIDRKCRRPSLANQYIRRLGADAWSKAGWVTDLIHRAICPADIVEIPVRPCDEIRRETMYSRGELSDLMEAIRAVWIDVIWIHRVNPVAAEI